MWKTAAVLLTGFLLTACTSLSTGGENVNLTSTPEQVNECEYVGEVTAYPPFITPTDWKKKLRNAAAEIGGDTVYAETPGIGTATGKAYKCKK